MATDPDDDWQERFEAALKKAGPIIAETIVKDSQRYGTPLIVIVFPLYSRTGLRTAPSVAHLDSLGIAPLGLFSAQYENKLETLYA